MGRLRDLEDCLKPSYSPDDQPLHRFYIPALTNAVSYDRAVGFWSTAELQYAAQGLAYFLAGGGRMRLIVGARLSKSDIEAVTEGDPLNLVLAHRMLEAPGLEGEHIVKDHLLSVLAWMVAEGRLEIKVGVPREGDRLLTEAESGKYFHTKYGIFTDTAGDRLAFSGSNNESFNGWIANHETFDAYPSWNPPVWEWSGQAKVADFERHWNGQPDTGWAVIPLPEAVAKHLISHAPDTPPLPPKPAVALPELDLTSAWDELVTLAAAPETTPYTAAGTAWVNPLPHQAHLVKRVVESYPRGYLLADQVGLGKTIETGLVLRELLLSGRAKTALLLVPASVMRQWQEELHEKMNLDVPRMEKGGFVNRFDQDIPVSRGVNPWAAFPIVLGSSHLARRRSRRQEILEAGPWDVVLVDEAHHARRRGSKPTDTPNALLALLLDMQQRGMWKALYLATATPMQMNPHEAWDLLALFGLPGRWGEAAENFQKYYESLRAEPQNRRWPLLREMLHDYFTDPDAERDKALETRIRDELGQVGARPVLKLDETEPSKSLISQMPNDVSDWMDKWLRRHTPTKDRVFRNTRTTLWKYQQAGIIPDDVVIPTRYPVDEFIAMTADERKLYDRIETYIRQHYNSYLQGHAPQALGFIMTIYRRRLTSSFEAIKCSLQRRLSVLENGQSLSELLTEDDSIDLEPALFDDDEFDDPADLMDEEIVELKSFLSELDWMVGEDTKASKLIADVNAALKHYPSVVVFTQYTDTMEYIKTRLTDAGITRIGCYSGHGGEVYDAAMKQWFAVTKTEIKARFRDGDLTVLVGTDSMSEGLNLQTCGRLINYDMPWNLMRAEQRIGRVDRIGASFEHIRVSNYFYKDTIEEQVYKGIKEDFADFTDIIGGAAPVLANVERVIEQLALGTMACGPFDAIKGIRGQVRDLRSSDIKNEDFGNPPEDLDGVEKPPALVGGVTLVDLEGTLTTNPLTAPLFRAVPEANGVYTLFFPAVRAATSLDPNAGIPSVYEYSAPHGLTGPAYVTFDRDVYDQSQSDVTFLTYGTPELASILPRVADPGRQDEDI